MNKKLTKAQVTKMTSEELQNNFAELEAALDNKNLADKDKNLIMGSMDLIKVEQINRKKAEKPATFTSRPAADGQGTEETITITKPDDLVPAEGDEEQKKLDESPSIVRPAESSVLDSVMTNIHSVLLSDDDNNTKLARIMKLAEQNVDYSKLPYELCTDAELMRRLKLLWSKRVAAKKAADIKALNEIEAEESLINSYRSAKTARTGVVSSDNVDHSKLSQNDLQKLIRNYQSKKSNAKKIYEATIADIQVAEKEGLTEQVARLNEIATEHKNLMEHWQAKVDDASKYRSGSTNQRSAELTKQIRDTIAMLQALPQSDEIAAKIKELEALL